MLNLLLEANNYYINLKQGNVSQLFEAITGSMAKIRDLLDSIKVSTTNDKNQTRVTTFFKFDFAFLTYNSSFAPILPKYVADDNNMATVQQVSDEIDTFISLCTTKILKKNCCLGKAVFCYFEQLEYILAYNYNAVKFEAPSYNGHKVPLMFFPAQAKHMVVDREVISKHGINVIISFDPEETDSIKCSCEDKNRPTVILYNPNALYYEQMVNYPHNFCLKYYSNK